MADVLQQFVNVHGLLAWRMTWPEQRIDERDEPIGFADDDRGVFAHRSIGELTREQLRRATQSAEWILDLMRELTNHRAAATDLRQQRVLACDALMLSGVADLDQHGDAVPGSSNGATVQSTTNSASPLIGRKASSRRENGRHVLDRAFDDRIERGRIDE